MACMGSFLVSLSIGKPAGLESGGWLGVLKSGEKIGVDLEGIDHMGCGG